MAKKEKTTSAHKQEPAKPKQAKKEPSRMKTLLVVEHPKDATQAKPDKSKTKPATAKKPHKPTYKPIEFFDDDSLRERLMAGTRKIRDKDASRNFETGCLDTVLRTLTKHPKSNALIDHFFLGNPDGQEIASTLKKLPQLLKFRTLKTLADALRDDYGFENVRDITRITQALAANKDLAGEVLDVFGSGPRGAFTRSELVLATTGLLDAFAEAPYTGHQILHQFADRLKHSWRYKITPDQLIAAQQTFLSTDVLELAHQAEKQSQLRYTADALVTVTFAAPGNHDVLDALLNAHYAHAPYAAHTLRPVMQSLFYLVNDRGMDPLAFAELANAYASRPATALAALTQKNKQLAFVFHDIVAIGEHLYLTANPGIITDIATFALAYRDSTTGARTATGALARVAEETQDDRAVQHLLNLYHAHLGRKGIVKATEKVLGQAAQADKHAPLDAVTLGQVCDTYLQQHQLAS